MLFLSLLRRPDSEPHLWFHIGLISAKAAEPFPTLASTHATSSRTNKQIVNHDTYSARTYRQAYASLTASIPLVVLSPKQLLLPPEIPDGVKERLIDGEKWT